jgi:hypothetical protein
MCKVSLNSTRKCRKHKVTGEVIDLPACVVCGKKGSPMTGWVELDDSDYLYARWRPVSQKISEMTGHSTDDSCCESCKRKLNREWRRANPDAYINSIDAERHIKLNDYVGVELTIAEFNHVMALSKTGEKAADQFKAMVELGIDYKTFNSVAEYTYYTRYNNYNPGTTIEEFREIRKEGINYAEFVEKENSKIIAYMQHGDETKYIDFITKKPFHVTDYTEAGNDQFKELLGFDTLEEKPDHHHFVICKNISVTKNNTMNPSGIMKTDILGNSDYFIEMMGTIAIGKTTHKLMHGDKLGGDFDINDMMELGIAPWWAQCKDNYEALRSKYPGVIDHIDYEEMIARHTLSNYLDGTYMMSDKAQVRFQYI